MMAKDVFQTVTCMDTSSPVMVDSIFQHLDPSFLLDIDRHPMFMSRSDRESPFPTIRPSSRNAPKARSIPIQFVSCDKASNSEELFTISDDDESSCLRKRVLDPESPLAEKIEKYTKISNDRDMSRSSPQHDRLIIIDDEDSSNNENSLSRLNRLKVRDSTFYRSNCSVRRAQPKKSDNLQILHSELLGRQNTMKSSKPPYLNSNSETSSSDSTKSSGRRRREIPVIVLDAADTKSERCGFTKTKTPVCIDERSGFPPNSSESASSRTDVSNNRKINDSGPVSEVNCPPGYPVYDVLRDSLSVDSRQIDYIHGDGNCFFRALSKQLYGVEKYHKSVRSLIMDLIATNKKEFAQFIDHEDVHGHVINMSEDRSWATTCEVYAAATLLQRDLYMLTPSPEPRHYKWLYFKPIFSMEPQCQDRAESGGGHCPRCYITLCNTNGNHYDRVVSTHGGCNCFLPLPQLDGACFEVDLTM